MPTSALLRLAAVMPLAWFASLPAAVAQSPSQAAASPQTGAYKCLREGRAIYSDRPCEAESRPATSTGRTGTPEHWQHLDRICRQKAEQLQRLRVALRTSDGEDSSNDTLYQEQQRYEAACAEAEDKARRRVIDDSRNEVERERARQEQADELVSTCQDMRRLRDLRKPRWPQLTPGERADFERFEVNFTRRCSGVLPRS